MRCLIQINDQWQKENPADLSAWIWQHDGEEAVVVDDRTTTYYCANEAMRDKYREKWELERRVGDKRTAAMFIDLARRLHDEGKVKAAATETLSHYCATTEALCSNLLPGSICQHCAA